MAPLVRLHRLVWGGKLGDSEGWSCSLHFNSPVDSNALASDFEPALIAWMGRASSRVAATAHLDEIKFNIIDPVTGKYQFPVSNTDVVPSSPAGTAPATPFQLTVAVSTRTALARGRAHAGRFYPPTGGWDAVMDNGGRITTALAQGMADSASELIEALNAAFPMGNVCVFSKVGQIQEPVTHVQVGRVVDTIRSRRTSLDEDPQSSPVNP